MSNNTSSNNYTNSRSYSHQERNPGLPGIHEVVGDVLARPARPEHDSSRAAHLSYGNHPSHQGSGFTAQRLPSSGHHADRNRDAYTGPVHYHGQPEPPRSSYPRGSLTTIPEGAQYTYSVLKQTQDGLVEQEENRSRKTSDPSRRYPCEECGERFDRPSSLTIHLRSHSREQPFRCGVQGCGKTFSIKSNMRRHERSHNADSGFEEVDEHSTSTASRSSSSGRYSTSTRY